MNDVQAIFHRIDNATWSSPRVHFTNEGQHGVSPLGANGIPPQLGIGHILGQPLVREIGRITRGLNCLCAATQIYIQPILDGPATSAGVVDGCLWEDPYLASRLVVEMKQKDAGAFSRVAATAKHFASQQQQGGRGNKARTDPQPTPPSNSSYFSSQPFKAASKGRAAGVNDSYND